jgi:hypothetical protein
LEYTTNRGAFVTIKYWSGAGMMDKFCNGDLLVKYKNCELHVPGVNTSINRNGDMINIITTSNDYITIVYDDKISIDDSWEAYGNASNIYFNISYIDNKLYHGQIYIYSLRLLIDYSSSRDKLFYDLLNNIILTT